MCSTTDSFRCCSFIFLYKCLSLQLRTQKGNCLLSPKNADYTTGQVFDLSEKLEQSEAQLGRGSFMLGLETHDKKSEDKLAKATRDR